jgi:hypothetical protein
MHNNANPKEVSNSNIKKKKMKKRKIKKEIKQDKINTIYDDM